MSKAEGVLFINVANYTMVQNSANVLVLESANNSVTLPKISTQNSIIFIVNAGTTPSIIQSSNLTTVITLQTSQSCVLCPLIAGAGNTTGSWIVLGFFPNNTGIIPVNSWNLLGNSGLASTGVLGTTDAFDTWKIIEGGNTIMNLINQGEINIPNVNIMSFGNRGSNTSMFIIKQVIPTSTAATIGPASAMQMISANNSNSFYWGVDSSGNFDTYSFVSPSTYTQLMSLASNGKLTMNNQNISNVLNPVNPQDVSTKNYTDTKLMPLVPQMSSDTSNASGFRVVLASGVTGFGDLYQPWNNPGNNGDSIGWGPNTNPTGTINMTFPATTQFKIGGIMLTNRNNGSSPTLTGIVLSIGANPPFFTYSGPPIAQGNSTGLLTFPLSTATNGVNIALTWSSTPFSGIIFAQLFGSL